MIFAARTHAQFILKQTLSVGSRFLLAVGFMKKSFASIFLIAIIFTGLCLSGCSWMLEQTNPRSVCLPYIDVAVDNGSSDSVEDVTTRSQAAVVSIIATYPLRSNLGNSYTRVLSGILIDADGYVLTHASVSSYEYSAGEFAEPKSVYAVLSDVYEDETRYSLEFVDQDSALGVSVYRFYDEFSHHTDASSSETEKGFQIFATFSEKSVRIGEPCTAIGNAVGGLNSAYENVDGILYIQQSITGGAVSALESVATDETRFSYIITSAPINENMYGGALFDENGYLLGLIYDKWTEADGDFVVRASSAIPSSVLTDYIDDASARVQHTIPYTIAA